MKQNAKCWICYDGLSFIGPDTIKQNKDISGRIAPGAYILFDLKRIESEIRDKCIFGGYKLKIIYPNFDFIGSKNILRLIQSLKVEQEILNFETWRLFDGKFENNLQRKKALIMIEEVIALINNSTANKDQIIMNNPTDDDEEDEKYDNESEINTSYRGDEELWHFMKHELKMADERYQTFIISSTSNQRKIKMKHIQSLWHELVKRIDGERTQYMDTCSICAYSIASETPITLDCSHSIHYRCLKNYIQRGFGNNGTRIRLQQLSCPLC